MMTFMPRLVVALALALALGASSGASLTGCTDCRNLPRAYFDISVTVTDAQTGTPVTDAMVSFSRAGGPVQRAEHTRDGYYAVPRAGTGTQAPAGSYLFTVTKPGYRSAMVMGSMAAGACADGDQLTVTLTPGS